MQISWRYAFYSHLLCSKGIKIVHRSSDMRLVGSRMVIPCLKMRRGMLGRSVKFTQIFRQTGSSKERTEIPHIKRTIDFFFFFNKHKFFLANILIYSGKYTKYNFFGTMIYQTGKISFVFQIVQLLKCFLTCVGSGCLPSSNSCNFQWETH